MNESDLRVKRTRQKLKKGMMALLQEKAYGDITVLEIVEQASVGHKTFYRHYPDKRALAVAILEDIVTEAIESRLPPTSITAVENNAVHLLQVIDNYGDVIDSVREAITLQELVKRLQTAGTVEVEQIRRLQPEGENTAVLPPLPLTGYYFITSIMQLIDWWIENGKPYPIEQMAEYINQLVVRPLWR